MSHLQNKTFAVLLLLFSMSFVFCKASQKTSAATGKKPVQTISYEKEIAPIITRSCSPCHFSAEGKKEPLDTYDAAKAHIVDILARVQLPASEIKFMPFKSKKPALTEAEIKLLKDWAAQAMPK